MPNEPPHCGCYRDVGELVAGSVEPAPDVESEDLPGLVGVTPTLPATPPPIAPAEEFPPSAEAVWS
jgi:hypothetical protein